MIQLVRLEGSSLDFANHWTQACRRMVVHPRNLGHAEEVFCRLTVEIARRCLGMLKIQNDLKHSPKLYRFDSVVSLLLGSATYSGHGNMTNSVIRVLLRCILLGNQSHPAESEGSFDAHDPRRTISFLFARACYGVIGYLT
jgi:hypothetical protein